MATKPVHHTVENLEAGQRDSIRRARAKAKGAKPEEYNNLPSDAEVSRAKAEARAEAQEEKGPGVPKTPGGSGKSEGQTRRGPSSGDEAGS